MKAIYEKKNRGHQPFLRKLNSYKDITTATGAVLDYKSFQAQTRSMHDMTPLWWELRAQYLKMHINN